jgi:hypothetical protein
VTTIEHIILLCVEEPSGFTLVSLGISTKRASAICEIILLPSKTRKHRGNHIDEFFINN